MSAAERIRFSEYWRLVTGNRNYRLLWLAQIVSEIGDWLYGVVIYHHLLSRTGSARAVAVAVVLQVLPQVVTSPMAGVLNDRFRRRSLMIFADWARAVIVLGMLVASHQDSVWPLYSLLFIETVMWGVFEPGRSSLLPNLTSGGRELLVANTLSSTTWSFNLAVGATLGGLLSVWLGNAPVFVINAASFVVSAFLLLRIRVNEPHAEGHPPFRARELFDFRPVLEGFRYIGADRRLLAALLSKAGLGFLGANYIILAILGERVFPVAGSPTLGMSLLMGARGLGALLGPAIATYWAGGVESRYRRGILYGFVCAAAGYILLTWSPSVWLAIACVTLAHGGGSTIWVFSTTIIQSQAEDRFRGRVFSADYAFLVMAMSASTWLAGTAVDMGAAVRTVSLATGALILIPTALWALVAMPLWREQRRA